MISFEEVIAILLSEMASSGQQLIPHPRISRCIVRRYLAGVGTVIESPGKERRVAAKSRESAVESLC